MPKNLIEKLPVEILEIIFHALSSLIDIQHCYETCKKWKQIIENMFADKGGKFYQLMLNYYIFFVQNYVIYIFP